MFKDPALFILKPLVVLQTRMIKTRSNTQMTIRAMKIKLTKSMTMKKTQEEVIVAIMM